MSEELIHEGNQVIDLLKALLTSAEQAIANDIPIYGNTWYDLCYSLLEQHPEPDVVRWMKMELHRIEWGRNVHHGL
jgi:hypothetical protein